jgi:S-disulfanyl-L-cysteine oxidoreductase SoxD
MRPAMMRLRQSARALAAATFCMIAALMASAADASAQQGPAPGGSSIVDGAYTAAQATRGEKVFGDTCGNCHGRSEFAGTGFQRKWAGQTVYMLFDQLRSTMPLDNPGGLSRAQYAAVIAYILQLNAYPAGDAELPSEDAPLRALRFEIRPAQQRNF